MGHLRPSKQFYDLRNDTYIYIHDDPLQNKFNILSKKT